MFIPHNPYLAPTTFFVTMLLITIAVALLGCFHHRFRRRSLNFWFTIINIIIFVLATFTAYLIFVQEHPIELREPIYTIYNSTMSFQPESDLFVMEQEHWINIQIKTGGESINAVEVVASYDPKSLYVEDLIFANSFCSPEFIFKKEIDNVQGKLHIQCGVLEQTFQKYITTVADILVQPLKDGLTTLKFEAESKVLANDGLGTNVLRSVVNGSYQIVSTNPNNDKPPTLLIFSYTHPNSERWYKNKNIHVEWQKHLEQYQLAYSIDKSPNYIPDGQLITANNFLDFQIEGDGVYYLHLSLIKSDAIVTTSHFKIQVDSTPPLIPEIKISADRVKKGDVVRFEFGGSDATSGLQKNYYVRFDGIFFPVLSELQVPFLEKGRYKVTLRVFDNANNFTDVAKEIIVE